MLPATRYDKLLCYAVLPGVIGKSKGSNKQVDSDRRVVSPLVANYLHIIAFHGDNSNLGMCPDLSSLWSL